MNLATLVKCPMPNRLRKEVKSYARWALLLVTAVHHRARHGKRVLFFPFQGSHIGSCLLRVTNVAQSLRERKWGAIVVPPHFTLQQRQSLATVLQPTAIIIQKAQHALNQPRLYSDFACIFDIDDADWELPEFSDATMRAVRDADHVIAGSHYVKSWCSVLNESVSVQWTATPLMRNSTVCRSNDLPILCWASSSLDGFAYERPFVQKVVLSLAKKIGPCFTYRQYGVRSESIADQFASPLRAAGVTVDLVAPLQYDEFLASVAECDIGIQINHSSSRFGMGKSFGKVLGYLVGGVAVVASNNNDHRHFFKHGENGLLANEDVDEWVLALESMIKKPELRKSIVSHASKTFIELLSLPPYVDTFCRTVSEVSGRKNVAQREKTEGRTCI